MPHTTDGFNSFHGSKAQVEAFLRRMNAAHAHDAGARPEPSAETPVGALEPKGSPKIGDLDDGGVYVGLSEEDDKPLHAVLSDEPKYLTFDEAFAAANRLKSQHPTAHVPTPKELNQLYENRFTGHLSGTFNTSGSFPASCYRSSDPDGRYFARDQRFADGDQNFSSRNARLPVRLVW